MSYKRGFKRKSYGRPRYSKRRGRGRMGILGYAKAGMSAYSMAKSALAAIWRLKGLVNSEMHKLDNSASNTVTSASGVVDPMCKVAVGDTYADRTGNSIFVRALNFKGTVALGASETTTILRLIVLEDLQQIADTTPAVTDIYESTSVNAHLNALTVGRFKILRDIRIVVDSQNPLKGFEINCPMRLHVRYNGSATTDIQKGALYFVQLAGGYTTNAPNCSYKARLSFHDN